MHPDAHDMKNSSNAIQIAARSKIGSGGVMSVYSPAPMCFVPMHVLSDPCKDSKCYPCVRSVATIKASLEPWTLSPICIRSLFLTIIDESALSPLKPGFLSWVSYLDMHSSIVFINAS